MRTRTHFIPGRSHILRAWLPIVLVCIPFFSLSGWAQTEAADVQITRLDSWIVQATSEGNHEAVAGLQRDRAMWYQVREALLHDDVGTLLALQSAMLNPYPYVPSGVTMAAPAVAPQTAAGPEFMNQVYSMPVDGTYLPLEKHEASRSSSGGGYGGFGARTSSIKIPGEGANVRFRQGQFRFVVKVYPGQDPSDVIKLVRFEVRGAKRERYADLSKSSHAWYHSSSQDVTANRVRISFKNVGDQVYEIVMDDPVSAGEYGFLQGSKVFAFGLED